MLEVVVVVVTTAVVELTAIVVELSAVVALEVTTTGAGGCRPLLREVVVVE